MSCAQVFATGCTNLTAPPSSPTDFMLHTLCFSLYRDAVGRNPNLLLSAYLLDTNHDAALLPLVYFDTDYSQLLIRDQVTGLATELPSSLASQGVVMMAYKKWGKGQVILNLCQSVVNNIPYFPWFYNAVCMFVYVVVLAVWTTDRISQRRMHITA